MTNLRPADVFQVDVKTLKNIAAVLCVTALAVPAGVAAKGPSGDHGKSGDQHGQNQEPKHANSRCKHQPKVGFSLGGTLDPSSTADSIVVVVTKSNKHSKPFVVDGKYTVPAGSKVEYAGSNPFTTTGADLTKYTVKVNGKVIKYKKGCTADTAPVPTVKKVKIHAPDASGDTEQSDQDKKPETTTQP
ncbi:MAG: hypothetical protein QOJ29_5443 [Thermoleophilaceae bacterium]|jgi:hypothetical protein|nr:hypothetical protein [Thermoleophilaceae bacterium]